MVLALLVWDATRTRLSGPPRRERLYWLSATVAALVLVPTIKRFSSTSCPWDLLPFGGTAPYVPHWWLRVLDGGPGHCFPSGHAVAAFGFFGVYFLWRPYRPVLAQAALAAVWLLGRGVRLGADDAWRALFEPHFVVSLGLLGGLQRGRLGLDLAAREAANAGVAIAVRAAGAGEGNRTLVLSLGSFSSAIELRPQQEKF
jgi:hypothetical protein